MPSPPVPPEHVAVPPDLLERVALATDLSLTISDARQDDNPLVWVNPAFERITGYRADAALGRNCRFLQGPDTDPAAVEELRRAVRERRPATVTLLNHRADGSAFWNEVAVSPVPDASGQVTHFVGVQADVTDRVLAEQGRQRALEAERAARDEAERMQARMLLLADATTLFASTLDPDEALRRLADLVVPALADWAQVHLVTGDAVHAPAAVAAPGGPVARVLAGGPPELVEVTPAVRAALGAGSSPAEVDGRQALVVPLRARQQVLGTLTLVVGSSGRCYGPDDLSLAHDLARRAALAVDNARLYAREHEVAEALQRRLLPVLPLVPGCTSAARYLPSGSHAQVGGDWYDLLPLPDGAIGVAIGDVMGHDVEAAAAMGQLRSVLRSYAWEGGAPGTVLDRLDRLVQGLDAAQLATALYGRLEPAADGMRLRYADAGHLPPLLRDPDGSARYLWGARSTPIGVTPPGGPRQEALAELPPGSVLVLCTDGLVEHRDTDLDAGLEQLRQVVEAHDPAAGPEALCDEILAGVIGDRERDDDLALLAVRVAPGIDGS